MNTSDIILYLVILLLPVVDKACRAWLLKFEQKLPAKQHTELDRFAKYAVQKMEQVYTHNPNKKQLAMGMIQRAFREADLPLPSESLVDSAIESFVFELNQAQAPKPAAPDPVILSTGPLPVPPVAPTQAPQA